MRSLARGFLQPKLSIASGWRSNCLFPTTNIHLTPFYIRCHHHVVDRRQRLSAVWVPTGGLSASQDESAHDKLVRAGFLRQTHSGIFHLLPLGRRVQDKLEALLDQHMQSLGASRIALSSVTSRKLWEESGRFAKLGPELFNFQDRKGTEFMLAPTHEEEVTTLVAHSVKSYKELPLRLYQITRKYRDELRPRHGLLRTREFTMKDLYTFDIDADSAMSTYTQVQAAYASFFTSLGLPFVKAKAGSGDMGGDLSHEYHFLTAVGEDAVFRCMSCDYAVNADVAEKGVSNGMPQLNTVKAAEIAAQGDVLSKTGIQHSCPQCKNGSLKVEDALEVGHTFFLGSRYSEPLGASIALPPTPQGPQVQAQAEYAPSSGTTAPIQMGCHGIGVSRLIGAVAEHLADEQGLQWPRVISPYEVAVVFSAGLEQEALKTYDNIATGLGQPIDVLLDDRPVSLPWKLKDADLVGYPIVIVLGQGWKKTGCVELQCRRLRIKEPIQATEVHQRVTSLLARL